MIDGCSPQRVFGRVLGSFALRTMAMMMTMMMHVLQTVYRQ